MESVDRSMIRKPTAFGTAMNVCQGGDLLFLLGVPAGERSVACSYGLMLCSTAAGQCWRLNPHPVSVRSRKPVSIACRLLPTRCAAQASEPWPSAMAGRQCRTKSATRCAPRPR